LLQERMPPVLIRKYSDADFDRIRHLHEKSGFDYKLPSLSSSEFYSRRVVTHGESIGMATFLRLTSEAILICDPSWRTPAWRMEALRQLSIICNQDAKGKGVTDVIVSVPPDIATKFGKRLEKLEWSRFRDGWVTYSHGVT
jgi:hypothetical protein